MRDISRRLALALPILGYLASKTQALAQGAGGANIPDTNWLHYAGDLASTRYSPIDQIGAANFKDLEIAWRMPTSQFGPTPEFILQSTPLVSKGRMFFTAGTRRSVVSVDAATGEVLWVHREDEGERAAKAARRGSGRGLAYWTDGKEERILYVTIGYQLVALDAKTGARVPGFGENGIVDLRLNDDQKVDLVNSDFGYNAAPAIGNDVVVIGAAHSTGGQPRTHKNVKGYVRGFDVRTGKRLWIFHTIPQKGEFGYDTWLDGTDNIGNAGVWGQISIDEKLNTAYLGVESATGDYNGQYRRGNALFGESIVAVDLKTGERKWHYQLVHHGLWDFDPPCAAILADVPINGKIVKVLAQPSKQGFLYVFNRETGKPIWPIVEKRVPKGDVPEEWYSPTQPFPTKPPPYDRQGIGPDDLIDFTPALHAEALRLVKNYRIGPLFTPPSVYTRDGTWGTIVLPNQEGGSNWQGGSYDPETHTVYVYSKTEAALRAATRNTDPARSDMEWLAARGVPPEDEKLVRDGFKPRDLTVQGLPLVKPPYGRITAIDLTKGDITWQVAHGETPDNIRNHPALKGLKIPRTGQIGKVAPLVTKTLLVCGDPGVSTTPSGQRGAMLRAYDKKTGEEKAAVFMPGPQVGSPMTYVLNGSQYIVLSIGGGNIKSEFIAFRLPRASSGPARPAQAGD
ncbi:MAG TPA: PQQ-binding-like beta-propeller repeat protein [Caulobacterales bacterium]|nr:PQQ-binding-like beta-propeller repeat protein [Caulobacterales bacterium]